MPKLIFFPDSYERGYFWLHVWFHGLAEQYAGGDLVRSNTNISLIRDGQHPANLRTPRGLEPAILYMWSHAAHNGPARKGLVVLQEDAAAREKAEKHFNEKSKSL